MRMEFNTTWNSFAQKNSDISPFLFLLQDGLLLVLQRS